MIEWAVLAVQNQCGAAGTMIGMIPMMTCMSNLRNSFLLPPLGGTRSAGNKAELSYRIRPPANHGTCGLQLCPDSAANSAVSRTGQLTAAVTQTTSLFPGILSWRDAASMPEGIMQELSFFILRILHEGHTPAAEAASTEGQQQDTAITL